MSQSYHESNLPLLRSIESTVREGVQSGFVVSADLTSEAAAKAAVDTNQATRHVSVRNLAIPTKQALGLAPDVTGDATVVTGSDVTDIYDLCPGTNNPGFSTGL